MQTLGLSDSTPPSESRFKSLFWPSVQSGADVDYLGTQGFWVATLVGVGSFVFLLASGHWIVGTLMLMFYLLGGVGIRERSRYAAVVVFVVYALDAIAAGLGVVRVIFTALLLSNVRATFIASRWKADSEEAALPPRLSDTLGDRFSDRLPMWLWPKVRIPYYILSVLLLALTAVGLAALMRGER